MHTRIYKNSYGIFEIAYGNYMPLYNIIIYINLPLLDLHSIHLLTACFLKKKTNKKLTLASLFFLYSICFFIYYIIIIIKETCIKPAFCAYADLGWNLHQVWWCCFFCPFDPFSPLEVNSDKSFFSFIHHTEKLNALAVTSAVVFNTASP